MLRAVKTLIQLSADRTNGTRPLANNRAMHFVRQRRGHCSRAIGIRKHMRVRNRRLPKICLEHGEVVVGFAWEADDHVRADRRVRNLVANPIDKTAIVLKRVRAAHRDQHAIARMLKRKMEMWCEPARGGHEVDDVIRAVHRLEGADSYAHTSSATVDGV